MNLALFDFDGTLTYHDSLMFFLGHSVGWPHTVFGALCLAPWLAGYLVGRVSNHQAKERVLHRLFGGMQQDRFTELGRSFARKVIPKLLKPEAMSRLAWHQASGHRVIVISASIENYLQPWCDAHGLELIATRLEVSDGRFTGFLASPNCFGPEKVRRLRQLLDPAEYSCIYAYGDSRGDREMLAMAHQPFFRYFPSCPSFLAPDPNKTKS